MSEVGSIPSLAPPPALPPGPQLITDEKKANALRKVNRSRGNWGLLWDWLKSLQIAILLFLLVRTFFVEAFKIPSGSMEKTLLVGDFLLVNKLVYGAHVPFIGRQLPALTAPTRGDVLVFQFPEDPTKNFVKRLVGLPGDTLAMHAGVLYLNGVARSEEYVTHSDPRDDSGSDQFRWQRDYLVRTAEARVTNGWNPSRNNWGPLVVPERSFFVLGDNRDNSLDSRYWGFVPDSLVRGRPIMVYYSYAPDSGRKISWLTHIRWDRLGDRVR